MRRFLAAGLVAAWMLCLALTPSSAQAAPTYLPGFNAGKTVQIDPGLKNHPTKPVNVDGLEAEVQALAAQHGLSVFVIITEKGDEAVPTSRPGQPKRNFAATKLIELEASWSGQPNFPHDRYLLIMIVRAKDDPTKVSLAASGGTELQKWGLTSARFGDANGPLLKDQRTYLPVDVKGFTLAVVRNVNGDVASYKSKAWWSAAIPYILIGGFVFALFTVYTVIWLIKRSQASALIAQWRPKVQNLGKWYLELNTGYLGMMEQQEQWRKDLEGKSLADFNAAADGFEKITVRKLAASDMFDRAEQAYNRTSFFTGWSGFSTCRSILTDAPVKLTEEKLSLKDATIFGGKFKEVSLTPDQLQEDLEQLFGETKGKLHEIKTAMEETAQNQKDIAKLFGEIDINKGKLQPTGLSVAPYEARLAKLKERRSDFTKIQHRDPKTAMEQSAQVELDATTLRDDIDRAVSLFGFLPEVESGLTTVTSRVATLRKQPIGYAYPLASGEHQPAQATTQCFLLKAADDNPDQLTRQAGEKLSASRKALEAGELDNAYRLKEEAVNLTGQANVLVDSVLAAKKAVESKVPGLRTALAGLADELSTAEVALATLTSDFLSANFADEPGRIDVAGGLVQETADQLATIKSLYDGQSYHASLATLTALSGKVKESRDALPKVQQCLDRLVSQRQEARDVSARCKKTKQRLKTKLAEHDKYTSEATDNTFGKLEPRVVTLATTAQNQVADWPQLAQQAHGIEAELTAVEQQIDSAKAVYDHAKKLVDALDNEVETATPKVEKDDTRQPAYDKLNAAERARGKLVTRMQKDKSDWAAIATEAGTVKAEIDEAVEMARTDHEKAKKARSAKTTVEAKYTGLNGRDYGYGVTADVTEAHRLIQSGVRALNKREYDDAINLFEQATNACKDADTAAERAAERLRPAPTVIVVPTSGGGGGNFGGGGGGGTFGGGGGSPRQSNPGPVDNGGGDEGGGESRVGGGGDF